VACQHEFLSSDFSPTQREVIDLWSWCQPWLDERSNMAIWSPSTPNKRIGFVNENIEKLERKLDGRVVICPICNSGPVRLVH
jgi:hypothetical protein